MTKSLPYVITLKSIGAGNKMLARNTNLTQLSIHIPITRHVPIPKRKYHTSRYMTYIIKPKLFFLHPSFIGFLTNFVSLKLFNYSTFNILRK